MRDTRPTYLLLPDLPDQPHKVDVEGEQRRNLIDLIGWAWFEALCEMEDRDAGD